MILPSQQLLQKYKNIVHQQAGINQDVFHWMANWKMGKREAEPCKTQEYQL
jgi:hypothetical protein